jgi:hypothetical protein
MATTPAFRPSAARPLAAGMAFAGCLILAGSALADPGALTPTNAEGQIEVTLKDHRFSPSEIHVPAGKRVELLVHNGDQTADEFDSTSLKVEKVIAGGGEGIVRIRALDPGRYPFMGEFHPDTAQGLVVAE